MTRDEIIAEARRWIGTPYRRKGRNEYGVDCLGLLIVVGRAFAVPHEDETTYTDWPSRDLTILKRLGQHLVPMPPDAEKPGLVGAFAQGRLPGHAGIFAHKNGRVTLIHAKTHPGYVWEDDWLNTRGELRLIGLFSLPGMTD